MARVRVKNPGMRLQYRRDDPLPVVTIEKSLESDEYIVSMLDGRRYRVLTRHLWKWGLTPENYRKNFGLPSDYPMVAQAYHNLRRQIAIQSDFGGPGRRARTRARLVRRPIAGDVKKVSTG